MAPPDPKIVTETNSVSGSKKANGFESKDEVNGDGKQDACNTLIFYVNGQRVEAVHIDIGTTLAVYLRENC